MSRRRADDTPRNSRADDVGDRDKTRIASWPSGHETRKGHDMAECQGCEGRTTDAARTCGGCRRRLGWQMSSPDQSGNHGGVNVGGHVGGSVVINPDNTWDSRVPMEHGRTSARAVVLPPDLLSVVAGGLTILGFVLAPHLADQLRVAATLVVLGAGAVALYAGFIAMSLRTHGFAVLPLGLGALERDEYGRTFKTQPVGGCPFCPERLHSRMTLAGKGDEAEWVCGRNPVQHRVKFDATQMPPLR